MSPIPKNISTPIKFSVNPKYIQLLLILKKPPVTKIVDFLNGFTLV